MAERLVGRGHRVRRRRSCAHSRAARPDSIGVLGSARATNEENYLAQKFARVVLGTNNVDCCARVCHAPVRGGAEDDARHRRGDQLLRRHRAGAAPSWSAARNATENHPVVGARIKQAVLRGAKLIVIDPRGIELARTPTSISRFARAPTSRSSTRWPARSSRKGSSTTPS